MKKTATLFKDARQKQLTNEVKKELNDSLLAGEDLVANVWDKVNKHMSTQEQNVRLKTINDELVKTSQANDTFRRMHERIKAVFDSNSPNGETLREWIQEHNIVPENLNEAGLVEFINDFKKDTGIDI